jgi:hypothetical protein
MSALGQKRTYALQKGMPALPPIATAKADFPQTVMSALPPKADMCGAASDVRFGPIADMARRLGFLEFISSQDQCYKEHNRGDSYKQQKLH